ncbi:hypothetical protein DFQ27_000161 [Actinomortierella ambigua]|uniref:OTU domain-containing protein n=1 Tax=Actinomortierella ambigua TaxID=1343610 RepID=A0A9P6QDA4_9FUNG|nr:hypothetical protein DFQ27_000161 [Actinomortierella ambigua]
MAPVKTRSGRHGHWRNKGEHKADPEDDNDDDFYGMRELKHQLASLNLRLKDTLGDGNCLFRALADQYTGSDAEHYRIRQDVCTYIEEHADHFKLFLDNQTVEAHVAQMRRNATYGGNVELVAFARLKRVDIRVYQPGYVFVIEGVDVKKEGSTPGQRPMLHIAYHSWEHYSSIRNIDGPFEGLPEINPRPVEQPALRKLTSDDPPRPIEMTIMKVTGTDDLQRIRDLMEKHKGDVDRVYEDIYEALNQEGDQDDDKSEKEEDEDKAKDGEKSEGRRNDKRDIGAQQLEESGEDEPEGRGTLSQEPLSGKAKRVARRIAKLKAKPSQGSSNIKDSEGRHDAVVTDSPKDTGEPPASANKASRSSTPAVDTPSPHPHTPPPRDSSPVPELVPIGSTAAAKDDDQPADLQGSRPSTPAESMLPAELTKPVVPKKRYISSREKKELAKRNQKSNRKHKGKQPSPTPSSGSDGGSVKSSSSNISGMRELFV